MAIALVTGANRGLGLGFVRQLLRRPQYSKIIATARSIEHSDDLLRLEEETDGKVRVVKLTEVSDVESCQRCAEEIKAVSPEGVNVLINNAGFANQPKPMTPLDLTTVQGAVDYHRTWSVNAYGPLLFSATLLDYGLLVGRASHPSPAVSLTSSTYTAGAMSSSTATAAAAAQPPVICNISSGQASLTYANELWTGGSARDDLYFHPVYACSKVALSGVTMHMARILRDRAIVGQVHPGWIKTTMGRTYANLTVDEAAGKVLDVISTWKTFKHSGQYLNEEGQRLPW